MEVICKLQDNINNPRSGPSICESDFSEQIVLFKPKGASTSGIQARPKGISQNIQEIQGYGWCRAFARP
jgi:hypothetical protein